MLASDTNTHKKEHRGTTERNVRLELIDGFRLELDGSRVQPLASAQRLLAFLALQGPVLRSVVAGTLWSDVPEDQALASLRTTLWRANQAVQGVVSGRSGVLALADFVWVDIGETVETLAGMLGTGDGAGQVATLLRRRPGELLPGWYDDWVLFERERLRQLRLHALEAAVYEWAARGNYAVAMDLALETIHSEPLRESAHRAVISVHLAEGNTVEAIRAFGRFRALLHDQLGVEPSESLTQLVFNVRPPAYSNGHHNNNNRTRSKVIS